jgi:hypothetical protein
MTSKRTLLLPLAALALGLSAASQSHAAIVVTLPTATVAGSIVITNDINFTVTTAGNVASLVFDEWVVSDGARNTLFSPNVSPNVDYSLNGSPSSGGIFFFGDNLGFTFNAMTANDGQLVFTGPTVTGSDLFTIKAATYNIAAGSLPSGFNPLTAQTFTGQAFIADGSNIRLSANTPVGGAIPEPGTTALGALAGLTLLRRRR